VTMPICPLPSPLVSTLAGQKPGIGASARPAASHTKRAVDISRAAQQLARLQAGDDDVDLARVHAIRAAIVSGDLQIDTSRIADGLIVSARELLRQDNLLRQD